MIKLFEVDDPVEHVLDGELSVIDAYYDHRYKEYNYLCSNILWYLQSMLNFKIKEYENSKQT